MKPMVALNDVIACPTPIIAPTIVLKPSIRMPRLTARFDGLGKPHTLAVA